jgi:hypothetical protein
MKSAGRVLVGIEAAQAAIGRAASMWEAADLTRVEAISLELDGSLNLLTAALEGAETLSSPATVEIQKAIVALKNEARGLERLVDAAAAFVRAAPAFPADVTSGYGFGGDTRPALFRTIVQGYTG